MVEDDPSLRYVIRLVLEQAGHVMTEAPNGRAALEQLNRHLPDLMLVDSRMPFVTGAELIERLRNNAAFKAIPIVLMTGFSDLNSAADAVIRKPFDGQQLLGVIAQLLG